MMTIMMSTILSMLGFAGLFMGAFYLLYNEILTSVGYLTTNNLSCVLCVINKIHVVMSVQSSIHTLRLEYEGLTMTTNNLKKKWKRT